MLLEFYDPLKTAGCKTKNRDGKKTEEIYAINLSSGKDISHIINQHFDFGIKRTERFNNAIIRAEEKGDKVLFIHNHPRGAVPSLADLNELLMHKNARGITVGHDGSIYLYSKPSRTINTFDLLVATRKVKGYNNIEKDEKILEELAKQFSFEFRKL